MGYKITRNLDQENIFTDYGEISVDIVRSLEQNLERNLPEKYVKFITKHNGAHLNARRFEYYDKNRERNSAECIAFIDVTQIKCDFESLLKQSTDDPNDTDVWKIYKYFDEKLIPFGDTGGGDFICFDYRNHDGDNPPIILWSHDVYDNSKRISFIANNFEEFINMLHEPED